MDPIEKCLLETHSKLKALTDPSVESLYKAEAHDVIKMIEELLGVGKTMGYNYDDDEYDDDENY